VKTNGILYRQNEMLETQCSLFPIDCPIPKLDLIGPSTRPKVRRLSGSVALGVNLRGI
jgi:hypothetical protein